MSEFVVLLIMQVTLFSSIAALLIIGVKQIFKCHIPPHIGLVMWIVLLARLICPIFPESSFSVYNYVPVGRDILYTIQNDISEEYNERLLLHESSENLYALPDDISKSKQKSEENSNEIPHYMSITPGGYLADVFPVEAEEPLSLITVLNNVILAVYLLGAIVSLSITIFLYHRAKRRAIITSVPCSDVKIYSVYRKMASVFEIPDEKLPSLRCGVSSMLVGYVSPQIVYRDGMDEHEAAMVFAHELSHYKHRDNAIILFSSIVACLFWFNPLIWIVKWMLREDVEILCDYRTLTLFRLPRTEYALMLCKNSAYDTLAMQAGCGMAATGRVLKKRLKTISLQNKKNFLPRFLSVLVCAAIIIVCLTNPVLSYSSEYSTYIENYAALTDSDEREMHFISETTVSTYLVQTATLLSDISNGELGKKIGNGNLENFKRICIANEFLSDEIANEIRDLKADTVLSNKSCALVNYAIVQLLSNGNENAEEFKRNLLPVMISVDSMKKIHEKLSPEESERLMMCYNLGVPGADVQFSRYITDDMYELICSRINDESMKKMLNACYFKLNINNVSSELLDQLTGVHDAKRYLENETYIYICDVNLSEYELSRLYRVINSAAAGEQETIYYLKQNESGCSFAEAERLFKKAGFSYSEMLDEYTKLCETPYIYLSNTESNIMSGRSIGLIQKRFDENDFAYDFSATYELIETDGISYMYERNDKHAVLHIHALGLLNTIVFPMINLDDGVQITGKCNLTDKYIASEVYKLGLIETNSDGVIDINKKLSCGEGIYYAYRLIGAMENYYK